MNSKDNDTKRINENSSIHELANQAKNTKQLVDLINKAYLGLTTDELIRLALTKPEELEQAEEEAEGKPRPSKADRWGW